MGGNSLSLAYGVTAMASLWWVSAAAAAITIPVVPVGNIGNAANTTGYGAVTYNYNIGKYEVTAGQYTAFLNAVGGVDTNALYNTNMSNTVSGSGIARSGLGTLGNPYTYTVDAAFVNRPVNYVSYWDATRFTNWLQNGQPAGAQGAGTTEDGAYTLTTDGITGNTITRNPGTTWSVTSEDEWYKAAYYNPSSGNYYLYPTSSNTAPGQNMADPSGNNANYSTAPFAYPIDSGKNTTVAGEFQNSASPYGTFDQGGNVWEWTEGIYSGLDHNIRGASFHNGESANNLQSSRRYDTYSSFELEILGFRVSQVPEPVSIALLGLGIVGMLVRRRGVALRRYRFSP